MDLPDKSMPAQLRQKKAPVIPKGTAKEVSRPVGRRFLDYIFAESPKHVIGKVATQVLLPRAKEGLEQAGNAFLHGMLFGAGDGLNSLGIQRGTVIRGNGVVINPSDYSNMVNPAVLAASASGSMTGPYRDLTVASQAQAEALLASLISDINQYRQTTVSDLYEAAALTPAPEHDNYGWYSVEGARIVKESDGFKLMLPKPVRL